MQILGKKWVFVLDYNFKGTDRLTLDAKGRVTMPARHREVLGRVADDQLTVTKSKDGSLLVFPRPAWEAFEAKVALWPIATEGWKRIFLGAAMDVTVDGASRVMISPELRKYAGLEREVLLVAMGRHFELWDAARFEAQEAATLAGAMPEQLLNQVM